MAAAIRAVAKTLDWNERGEDRDQPPRTVAADPAAAWQAVQDLKPGVDDLICVTGSFFLLGQMRKAIEAAPLES